MLRKITAMGFWILFLAMLIVPCAAYAYETLSWDASDGEITGYRVYYDTTQGEYAASKDVGNVTQYSLSKLPLTEGVKYYFIVRAYNVSVESDNSNEVSLTVTDSTPPMPPLSMSYNEQSSTLEWKANTENDLKEYRVYSGAVSRSYSPFVSVGKNTGFSTSNLESGTTYYFAVTAVDNAGNESGYSSEVQGIVQHVTQQPVSEQSIQQQEEPQQDEPQQEIEGPTLTWDPAEGDIMGYRIYYGTSSGNYGFSKDVGNVTQISLSEFSLEMNTTYYFVVRSFKGTDESDNSNETSWTNGTVPDTTDGAGNSAAQSIKLVHTQGDTTPPTIKRIKPTSWGYYFTRRTLINLAGMANDTSGVEKVEWSNTTLGTSGTADGTAQWEITGIKLKGGWNVITITATDSKGNEAVSKLKVVCWSF